MLRSGPLGFFWSGSSLIRFFLGRTILRHLHIPGTYVPEKPPRQPEFHLLLDYNFLKTATTGLLSIVLQINIKCH